MLSAIKFVIKITVFSIVVLVLGNWVKYKGSTLSDQVKSHLSFAERTDTGSKIKKWTGNLINHADEEIAPSEREKLRSLIRELNRSKNH